VLGALVARYQPEWLKRIRLGGPILTGPTVETALFLDGRWKNESVFVQLITKLDESGTHSDATYMTMGGYGARLGQWNRFDHRWKKALRKARLPYFHVAEHGGHPFALKAVKIADHELMFGFVVRLDKADYAKHYREGGWGGKTQPDSMYGLCFRYCLSAALRIALAEMPRDGLVLNFITESGHANEGAAAEIVSTLKRKHISGVSEYLGKAATDEKENCPGLQAADGVTTGAWHLEKRGIPLLGPPQEPSLANWDSKQHGWKVPILRCHIDAKELASFKEDYFAHVDYRRKWGEQRTAEVLAKKQTEKGSSETPDSSGGQSS
jgi:hypothetical protein